MGEPLAVLGGVGFELMPFLGITLESMPCEGIALESIARDGMELESMPVDGITLELSESAQTGKDISMSVMPAKAGIHLGKENGPPPARG